MFQLAPPTRAQFDGLVGDVFFRPWLLRDLAELTRHIDAISDPAHTVDAIRTVLLGSLCTGDGQPVGAADVDGLPLSIAMEMVRYAVALNRLTPNAQDETKKNSSELTTAPATS